MGDDLEARLSDEYDFDGVLWVVDLVVGLLGELLSG